MRIDVKKLSGLKRRRWRGPFIIAVAIALSAVVIYDLKQRRAELQRLTAEVEAMEAQMAGIELPTGTETREWAAQEEAFRDFLIGDESIPLLFAEITRLGSDNNIQGITINSEEHDLSQNTVTGDGSAPNGEDAELAWCGMNRQKLAVVLIGVLAIGGVIVFRLRPARQADSPVANTAPAVIPPQVAERSEGSPAAQVSGVARVSIPSTGWGRNPFMSREEIEALNAPPVQEEAPAEVAAPVATTPALPQHELTGIVANPGATVAVIGTRVVRVGDRLGSETVKEIRARSIVLESEGQTREISLNPPDFEMQPAVPRGELQ
jgi:hypothetical protein